MIIVDPEGIPIVWFGRARRAEHPSSEKADSTRVDLLARTDEGEGPAVSTTQQAPA
jgi:hypothetical protein